MELKELLGESYKSGMTVDEADKFLSESGAKLFDLSKGEYVGKGRYQSLENDLKSKTEENAQLIKQLDELKKNGSAEMKDEITKLQNALKAKDEEYTAKYNAREREYLINDILRESKPKNLNALKGALKDVFDFDNAKVNDGKIDGLESVLNKLKETDAYLFENVSSAPKSAGLPTSGTATPKPDNGFNFNFVGVRKKD